MNIYLHYVQYANKYEHITIIRSHFQAIHNREQYNTSPMKKPVFDRNQPFNELPLLPPYMEIDNDPQILKKLVSASRALAEVNGHILRLPNPYMLINTIALQEARTSTEIENIFTTEDDLYKAMSETTGD